MNTPLLVKTDATARESQQSIYMLAKAAVQAVVNTYKSLELPALSKDDFHRLFNATEELIFDKVTGGDLSIGDHAVNKATAIAMVQKPVGYASLTAAIESLQGAASQGFCAPRTQHRFAFALSAVGSHFNLNPGGDVVLSPRLQAAYDDAGNHYVETDRAKAVFHFIEVVVSAYFAQGLDQHFPLGSYGVGKPIVDIVGCIARLDYKSKTYEMDIHALNVGHNRQ